MTNETNEQAKKDKEAKAEPVAEAVAEPVADTKPKKRNRQKVAVTA